MPGPLLGRTEDFLKSMSDKTRYQILKRIMAAVRDGTQLESACWFEDVDPEWFESWMKEEPRVRRAIMREWARAERDLMHEVRAGGPGMSKAKAALEILERQFKSWSRKTNVTLSSQLDEALTELEKRLDANTFETVVNTLAKYA